MKKIILTVILVVFVLVFAIDSKCAIAAEYKSFAELHPEIAQKNNIAKLGETAIKDGNRYHVISECKHPDNDRWVLWIDYAAPGKDLTKGCVFAVYLRLDGKDLTLKINDCMLALLIITKWCVRNNISVEDYIHSVL